MRRLFLTSRACGLAVWLWLLCPETASAHMRIEGSALFSGLLQPLTHPEGILGLMSVALWTAAACRGGSDRIRFLVWSMGVGVAAGVLLCSRQMAWISPAILVIALLAALWTAADRPVAFRTAQRAVPVCGFLLGGMWREGLALDIVSGLFFAAGVAVSAAAGWTMLTCAVALSKGTVMRIGFRVLSSWIAAVCAMLLAFLLRPGS